MAEFNICVLIPYFQRQPEPLARAITSVLQQQGVSRPYILIVDDSSPCPAEQVLSQFHPALEGVRVILQKNGGAGHARNTGLDHLPEATKFVAFLDSDDEWTPDHLKNAISVLTQGCDFYFADHQRDDWDASRFAKVNELHSGQRCLDAVAGLYEYDGDILELVLGRNAIKTSSVVFRSSVMEGLQFPVDLVLGEDEVFWVQALRRARKAGFGTGVEVNMGQGVNISQGGQLGNDRTFELLAHRVRQWQRLPELLPNEKGLTAMRERKLSEIRQDLASNVLFRLRRMRGVPLGPLLSITTSDPLWLSRLGRMLFRKMLAWY